MWDIFIENATKENSELNAMGLTKLLNKYELNYRDYLWTIEINDLGEKDRIVSLAYFIEEGNKSSLGFAKNEASEETRRDENIRTRVMEAVKQTFRPEFLNRLDEIIMFHPLTKDDIGGIIQLIVDDLNKRLSDRDLHLELTPEARQFVVDNAYDPAYGARPLKRYIQKNVETLAAKLILQDAVDEGDTILIDVKNGSLTAAKQA